MGRLPPRNPPGKLTKKARWFELTPQFKTQKENTSCDNKAGGVFMSGKKGMVHYDLGTKLEALRLHKEGLPYRVIAERLRIRDPERIRKWMSQYRLEGEAGLCKKGSGRPRKKPLSQEAYIQKLEMENELLKKYHTELRKLMPARRDIGSLNTTGEDIQ